MDDPFWDQLCCLERPPTTADWDRTDEGEEKIGGGAWMDRLTGKLAARPQQERDEFAQICKAQEAEIRMCLAPESVALSWIGPDQCRKEFRFSTPKRPIEEVVSSPPIAARRRRLTSFPVTILVIAAELAADTLRRRGGNLPFPPSGSNPESGNASDPGRSEAPTRDKQPREPRAAGILPDPEATRVCVHYQAQGSRGPLPLSKEPRSYAT